MNYDLINKNNLYNSPFPHLDISDMLDINLYNKLANDLDILDLKYFKNTFSKNRYQIEITEKDNINHLPINIINFIKNIFDNKDKLFSILSNILEPKSKNYYLLISITKDFKNYHIGPHPDSPLNIYTILLYTPINNNNKNLGTELYINNNNCSKCVECGYVCPTHHYKKIKYPDEKNNFIVKKKTEFIPNKLIAFAPGVHTWHGVRHIDNIDKSRNSIQIFYMKNTDNIN